MSKSKLIKYLSDNFWNMVFAGFIIVSLSVIISAFYIDMILGFDPCILCLYQRIPYAVILLLSIIAIIFPKLEYKSLLGISFALIIGAGISIYHTGIEKHWWDPTSKCIASVKIGENTSYQDFLLQLNSMPIGDCSKPAFHILSLSLAEMNIIVNFILFAILVKLLKKHAKTKI